MNKPAPFRQADVERVIRAEENPSVNRYLEDKAMDHIDHALGRPVWPLRESYRNNFAIGEGCDLAKAFDASPHWQRRGINGTMAFFSVTQAGRAALADHLKQKANAARAFIVTFGEYSTIVPAKSHGAARYSYFLTISDCFADLTFSDFAKRSSVKLITSIWSGRTTVGPTFAKPPTSRTKETVARAETAS